MIPALDSLEEQNFLETILFLFSILKIKFTIIFFSARGSSKSTFTIKEAFYPYGECSMPKNVIGIRKTDQAMYLRVKAEPNSVLITMSVVFIVFMSVLAAFMFIYYQRNGAVLPGSSIRYIRKV